MTDRYHREILQTLCGAFRDSEHYATGDEFSRQALAEAFHFSEVATTAVIRILQEVGFLSCRKKGARFLYSRKRENREQAPDLPHKWFWNVHIWHPRGMMKRDRVVGSPGWTLGGSAAFLWTEQVDGFPAAVLHLPKYLPGLDLSRAQVEATQRDVARLADRAGLPCDGARIFALLADHKALAALEDVRGCLDRIVRNRQ